MHKNKCKFACRLFAIPIIASLFGCHCHSGKGKFKQALQNKLAEELNDQQAALKLSADIEEVIFTMTPPSLPAEKFNVLIAFAFGNRQNEAGDPNQLAIPGPMNKELADCCAAFYRRKRVPMYVQWEIARYLLSGAYPDIPANDVISIEPYWDENGKLIYLSTDGVAEEIINKYFNGNPQHLGTAAVIGHRDHVKRCIKTCRSRKIDSYAVQGIELPVWYDELSGQAWTRRRELYVLQDLAAQLMMTAQSNIVQAYPKG